MQKLKFNVWGPFGNWISEGEQGNDPRCEETEREYEMLSGDQFAFEDYEPINELFDHEYYDFLLFTGLRDKQGCEIYAEDILKDKDGVSWIVLWNKAVAGFELKHVDQNVSWMPNADAIAKQFTKIGDFYRNPELLGAT